MLSVAAPSFESLWVSDHFMTEDRFRMECWTELTWIAARYPGPLLGTIVLGNSYRHPPLLAKMAASLQYLSGGRFILGYGAGWAEDEYRAYGYDFPSARDHGSPRWSRGSRSSGRSGRASRLRTRGSTTG